MPNYDIERYLNVRRAYGAAFSADGDRLTFLMDTTGTPQVWSIGESGAWPRQHTFFEERVTFVDYSPDRPEAIFGMDEGGNERAQLYRLDFATGEVTDLTRHPDAKHRWGGWANDADRFAFTSNRRDEAVFDVYVQDRDAVGEATERLHEGDGWLSLAGWSPDDTRLLVVEAYSNFDQDLYVLDLDSGGLSHVTPHEGDVRYSSPEWGPDGESIYCCTDRETDTLRLERLDLETGEFEVVEGVFDTATDGSDGSDDSDEAEETDDRQTAAGGRQASTGDDEWNTTGVSIDIDSRRAIVARNVEGYTELTFAEIVAPDRFDPVHSPDFPGVVGGAEFAPDADRVAVTVSASTVNPNVFVIDWQTGETEQWTAAATAGIQPDTFVEPELVRYPTFDGRQIPAFFSLPEDDTGKGETPVIVDIHGGPESQRRPSFNGVKQFFLHNGYAVFEPNVRGSSGYGRAYAALDDVEKRMDSVADIEAAVEWLEDHPAIDPDRIVAMGGSYGGFMVLAAMTEYPDLWAAGIDIVGIANFVTFLENTGEWRRELREAEYGSLEDDREFLESISPINNVEAIEAPLFVLHGENDPRVPVEEAEQIVAEVQEQGVPVEKLIFEDEGHGFTKLENRIEAYSAIVEFLDRHV